MLTTAITYWLAIPVACGFIAMLFFSVYRQIIFEVILPLLLEAWVYGIIVWGLIFGGFKVVRWAFS